MINLIPPIAKKQVLREYRFRVFSVWLILLALMLLISSALAVPTLFLIESLSAANQANLSEVREDQSANEEVVALVKDSNGIVSQVNRSQERIRFSELIYLLDSLAKDQVSLTQFTFKEVEGKVDTIALIGFASSRSSLSDFKEALERHESFSNVELPISNLAKDRDITFSMKVNYEETKP